MARIGPSANLCRHMLYRAVALAAGFGGGELTAWGLRGDAIRARLQAVRGRLRRKVHSAQPLTEAEEEMQALLLREDGRWLADEQVAAAEVRAPCRTASAVHRAREGSGAAAQRLVLGRLLGRGGFADVYATEWDGRPAAQACAAACDRSCWAVQLTQRRCLCFGIRVVAGWWPVSCDAQ